MPRSSRDELISGNYSQSTILSESLYGYTNAMRLWQTESGCTPNASEPFQEFYLC